MRKTWATFEDNVRALAGAIWGQECHPEQVGGVNIDGVMRPSEDIHVFIEITEQQDLEKVRGDVIKLLTAKNALMANTGCYARCYCVVQGRVTNGMIKAGEPHQIKVVSFDSFRKLFYDFESYLAARVNAPFGSAVNPLTGIKDDSPYISVKYDQVEGGREYTVRSIASAIADGKRVVLLGEYGTGKSRCIKEIFSTLADQASRNQLYPFSVDLREAWGLRRGVEIIGRHLDDLGAGGVQASAMRALQCDCLLMLLDGFDELGSQAWSNDSDKLKTIRAKSLEGVRDLIGRSNAGMLISGREHYFNSNEEMFSALGLRAKDTLVLRCRNEFSEMETEEFFRRLQEEITVPDWLPRRPLICQAISQLSPDDLDSMFGVGRNEIEFWDHFISVLCEREARIHPSLDAGTIEKVLVRLGRMTRSKSANVGPITPTDVQAAFEAIVGQAPVEDASVMLQRLPALGRLKAESNDRQFIDTYILDGLRAKDVALALDSEEARRILPTMRFLNPLEDLGQRILASKIDTRAEDFISFAQRCLSINNTVLACDIVSSLHRSERDTISFSGLSITDGHFYALDMSRTIPSGISISDSVFGKLILPSSPPRDTNIRDCIAERVIGVSSSSALPAWITNLAADIYDSVDSVSHIRKMNLDPRHEILVTVIRKTFFQKGSGRKEEALLRGLNRLQSPAIIDKILNILLHEGILTRFRGDEGWVYKPNRSMAGRMKKMLYELRTSGDPVWTQVGSL